MAYLELLKLRIVASVVFASWVGYFLAKPENPDWLELLMLSLVSFFCSAASCVFNHAYESDIDGRMDRTSGRPLPSGRIRHPWTVWLLCFLLFATGSALALLFFKNTGTWIHFALGFTTYAIVYTVWLKPRTPWSIVWGGAAGSFAVLGGASAAEGSTFVLAASVATVFFFWTPPHYWSIALRYRDDYAKTGLPVLPLVVGERRTAWIILISTLVMVVVSLLPVAAGYFGTIYLWFALCAAAIFIFGNIKVLRSPVESCRLNFRLSFVYVVVYFSGSLIDCYFRLPQPV